MKCWAYGKCGLKPSEVYSMELLHLGDIITSFMKVEEEKIDIEMQMLAWQTALLMNSTGNYKKKIKPEDLYNSIAEIEKEEQQQRLTLEDKKKLEDELLSLFNVNQ